MRKELFTFTASAKGYMISYRGEPIGGAGIAGEPKGNLNWKVKQAEEYSRMAKRDIEQLVAGSGPLSHRQQIQYIDSKKHELVNYADIIQLYMRSSVTKPEDRKNILPRLQDLPYYNHVETGQLFKNADDVKRVMGDAWNKMGNLDAITYYNFTGDKLIKGN